VENNLDGDAMDTMPNFAMQASNSAEPNDMAAVKNIDYLERCQRMIAKQLGNIDIPELIKKCQEHDYGEIN
jgi:hypothetical protein